MKKMNISFKDNELEQKLYDYLKDKFSPSAYLKQLLLEDMKKKGAN